MLRILRFLARATVGPFVMAGVLSAASYFVLSGPEQEVVPDPLAVNACRGIIHQLVSEEFCSKLAVLPVRHDQEERVRLALYHGLRESGKYEVLDLSFTDDILKENRAPVAPVQDQAMASRVGRTLGVEGVVLAEITEFSEEESGNRVSGRLRVTSSADGTNLFADTFDYVESPWAALLRGYRTGVSSVPWYVRLILAAVFVGILPLAAVPISWRLLDRESNRVNGWLLLAHVAVGLLFVSALVGFEFDSPLNVFLVFLALLLSVIYTYKVLSRIELFRTGEA